MLGGQFNRRILVMKAVHDLDCNRDKVIMGFNDVITPALETWNVCCLNMQLKWAAIWC